jgi:hypothetical protein
MRIGEAVFGAKNFSKKKGEWFCFCFNQRWKATLSSEKGG